MFFFRFRELGLQISLDTVPRQKSHFQLDQHTYNENTYRMDHHTQYFLLQRKMGGQYTDIGRCHRDHNYDTVQVLY